MSLCSYSICDQNSLRSFAHCSYSFDFPYVTKRELFFLYSVESYHLKYDHNTAVNFLSSQYKIRFVLFLFFFSFKLW